MPDKTLKIEYTNVAINDSIEIKAYLIRHFTKREVNNFYHLLERFEKVVKVFPLLYPVSNQGQAVHRAVLSKQLSTFYTVSAEKIIVIAMLDNRMDSTRWP